MSNPNHRSALVFMIDGLSPRYLSPYGCTWVQTPAMDQLTAESITFERAVAEAVDLQLVNQSLMSGWHPLACQQGEPGFEVVDECRKADVESWLLTDDPVLLKSVERRLESSGGFDHIVALPSAAQFKQSAESLEDTHLASCFAQVIQDLPQRSPPFLLVVHLTSLTQVWDAPLAMRERHRDEEDPEVPDFVVPPNRTVDATGIDPDEIHAITCAYAAQVETLDTCLDVLLQETRADGMLDKMLVCLTGLRGFPLGHNNQVGHHRDHLFSDATSIPVMVRDPYSGLGPFRTHELTTSRQVLPFAVNWITGEMPAQENGQHASPLPSPACLVTIGESTRAITTPAWLMIDHGSTQQLFVKPDDRWDVNPVHDRCRWIVDDLLQLLDMAAEQLAINQPLSIG
ncbi:MAG: hypothetical protein ACR2NP_16805 [Pirellulaceae bacterium]